MKNSIDFLPERKQRDLHELAALIRDEVKDVVMISYTGVMRRIPMSNATNGATTACGQST